MERATEGQKKMKIPKENRADPNLEAQVKIRLAVKDYQKLQRIALVNNTYASTMARRAILKYIRDLEI